MSGGFERVVLKAWRDNILLSAHLELTYACNLDCTFCYNDRARTDALLTTAEWIRLLDDLAAMQVLTVILSGGEPTVHPDFFRIGAHAKARGFVVRLKTNGHGLRGEVLRRVVSEVDPFIVEISLHGATPSTHDQLTQVPGSFERLIANLESARDHLRIQLNVPLTTTNAHEIEGMFAIADRLGLPMRVDPEVTPKDNGDMSPLALAPTAEQLAHYFAVMMRRSAAQRAAVQAPAELSCASGDVSHVATPTEKHCGAGSASLLVDPFGFAMPCVQWRVPLGNVKATAIAELWRSQQIQDIRAQSVAIQERLRGETDHCPGIAQALTGSLFERSEHASRRATARQRAKGLPVLP